MLENKDKLKEIAASLLAKFEAAPPEDMWTRIELQLRRSRKLAIVRFAAIAASVLVLLGFGLSMLLNEGAKKSGQSNLSSNNINISAKDTATKQIVRIASASDISDSIISEQNRNSHPAKSNRWVTPSRQREKTTDGNIAELTEKSAETESGKKEIFPAKDEIAILQDIGLPDNKEVALILAEPEIVEVVTAPIEVKTEQIPVSIPVGPDKQPLKESQNKNWGLAFGYGSNPAIELSQQESSMNSSKSNFSYDALSAKVANETSYFEEVANTTHNAPVSLGILISKAIGKRWSLETGLVYTKLGYQIKSSEINATYHEFRNEIYYVGIPLGIRFGLLQGKHFGVFATQSLIIEKGIAGRAYTDTYKKGLLSGTESKNVSIRGIQLSSLTGLGAEMNIAPKFALYGQGGVQLFFLNGSQPYNIRSARMAWPSFQVGLRIKMD